MANTYIIGRIGAVAVLFIDGNGVELIGGGGSSSSLLAIGISNICFILQ